MKFKIPKKVQVAGVDFEVVYQKGLGRNNARRGETQFFDRRITLDPDLPHHELESTFMHEVTHAVEDTYCCNLKESQITRMAQGIYQVLRQLETEV